jgi:hypothetical protein
MVSFAKSILGITINGMFLFFLLASKANSDAIHFKNGEIAKIIVADTNGCSIRILNRGKSVQIEKRLIQRIIWNMDTISYENFVCSEKVKLAASPTTSPEQKLLNHFSFLPLTNETFRENTKIAFLAAPLKGNYDTLEFAKVINPLIDILNRKATTTVLTPIEMLNEINLEKSNYDYAFIAMEYHVEMETVETDPRKGAKINIGGKEGDVFTLGNFILYSLPGKKVVLHEILLKKGTVWGRNVRISDRIFIPKHDEKYVGRQIDEKLAGNAEEIRMEMGKSIKNYLGIQE